MNSITTKDTRDTEDRISTKSKTGVVREDGSTPALTLLTFVSIVASVAIAFFAYHWWMGEERVVKRRLDDLAVVLSPPADGELAMIGRIVQLRGFFAPDVHIRFGAEEIESRDALAALLGRWQPPKDGFSLEFVDVVVHLMSDDTAHISLTAQISNRDAKSGQAILDAREGTLTMKKLDGDWVIAVAETTETLQR